MKKYSDVFLEWFNGFLAQDSINADSMYKHRLMEVKLYFDGKTPGFNFISRKGDNAFQGYVLRGNTAAPPDVYYRVSKFIVLDVATIKQYNEEDKLAGVLSEDLSTHSWYTEMLKMPYWLGRFDA